MSSPLAEVELVGRYVDAANKPVSGHLLVTAETAVAGQGWIVTASRVRIEIVRGHASGRVLLEPQDPPLSGPLRLRVSVHIHGVPAETFTIVPSGPVVDLATVPRTPAGPVPPGYVPATALGQPHGVATLDDTGRVPTSQLPPGQGGTPITVHGQLSGLDADDHPQYLTGQRADARYAELGHTHTTGQITDLDIALAGKDDLGAAADAVADHVASPDPHPRYLTQARADARYAPAPFVGDSRQGYAAQPWVVPDTGGLWAPFAPAGSLSVPAEPGQYVQASAAFLIAQAHRFAVDLAVLVAGGVARFLTSGTAEPAVQGLPGSYPIGAAFQGVVSGTLGFVATAQDVDDGMVTLGLAVRSDNEDGRVYGTAGYPLAWSLRVE